MVMRAAIGDFEETLIFGAMQQSPSSGHSIRDKRNFFLPDIRSFALIALEIISNMCEKKFCTYQYEWDQYISEQRNRHPNNEYPNQFYEDSDFEDEQLFRHKPDCVRSPGEVIEDYQRSRSMSPGSRPLSAQSSRSQRSRTLSPHLSKSHHSPAITLFESREQTPEPMDKRSRSKSPFSKRSRSKSPFSRKHKKNRTPDPWDTQRMDSPLVTENEKSRKSTTPSNQKGTDAFITNETQKSQGKAKLKKVDSKKWMISKLKTITGSETTVSAFKPKHKKSDMYDSNDEISEEEIQTVNSRQRLSKKKRSDSKNSMQYDNDITLHKSLSNQSNYSLQNSLSGQKDNKLHQTNSGQGEQMVYQTMARQSDPNSFNKMSGQSDPKSYNKVSGQSEHMMHRTMSGQSEHMIHRTASNHSDQWSILSDMEYPRSHGLKNTVSQDSRASMWSNLPLPVEMIEENRDNLDEIIDCLPGMTETVNSQLQKNPHTKEHLLVKNRSVKSRDYWRSDGPGTQRFELIDYYDELQGKFVKKMAPHPFYRSSSGSNMLPKSVHRTYSGTQVLHRTSSSLQEITEATEVSDNDENENFKHDLDLAQKELISLGHIIQPQENTNLSERKPIQKIKPVIIQEESEIVTENKPHDIIKPKLPKKKRSKSAREVGNRNLDDDQNEQNLVRNDSQRKKNQARAALQKKLGNRTTNVPVVPLSDKREKANLQVKYANVKKLKTQSSVEDDKENFETVQTDNQNQNENLVKIEEGKDQTHDNKYEKFMKGVSRYSSFSSNDSGSSLGSSVRVRKADVSLTSGELTSLSSQADVDTDGYKTDFDLPYKGNQMRKKIQSRARISDSGFDSESSELSSDYYRNNWKGKTIRNCLHHDQSQLGIPIDKLPHVSVDSKMNLSETAFVLTGFEHKSNYNSPEQHDIEEEILPENDIVPHNSDDDTFPTSGMSRIIEVSSASPEDIKDLDDDKNKNKFSKTGVNGYAKSSQSVSKTSSQIARPKTPAALSVNSKELRGPNVYASPVVAMKRYRELTKKGVPLRVSVISSDSPKPTEKDNKSQATINEAEDSGNVTDDQKLFNDLESNGFFKTPNPNKLSPIHKQHRKSRKDQPKRRKINKWQLDDIIREIPEESRSPSASNKSPCRKSQLDNSFHNQSGEEAMLNQPHTSEDSETASVQNSAANSIPPTGVPKQHQPSVVVDAELYIDRVYSKNTLDNQNGHVKLLDPDFDSPLSYDKMYQPLSDVACMNDNYNENVDLDIDVPLLEGMNEKHVINCRKMTTQLNLISFHDLLPANLDNFTTLKTKLQQGGQLGNIGSQVCYSNILIF